MASFSTGEIMPISAVQTVLVAPVQVLEEGGGTGLDDDDGQEAESPPVSGIDY